MLKKESIISYESNVMFAAILCLILVILFVLLLQIYAKWFLAEAQHRQTRATISMARVLSQVRLGQEHSTTYTYDITSHTNKKTQHGLDLSMIESIPVFIYGSNGHEPPLECAICLNIFDGKEVGRSLPRCSHAFHVECIDMWLYSHSTCPICRAQVAEDEVDESRTKHRVELNVAMDDVADDTIEMEEYSRTLAEMLEEVNEEVVNNVFSSFDSSLRMLLARSRSVNSVYASSSDGAVDIGTVV